MSFAERHGLWTADRSAAAKDVAAAIAASGLEVVRLSFPDQHGILRGKTLVARDAVKALSSGCGITTTLLLKDTAHRTVFSIFTPGGGIGLAEMEGGADAIMLPDPTTFRVLPWAEKTGWLLCDLFFTDGRAVPFATRGLYRGLLEKLAARGHDFVAGVEVELHIFKLTDAKLGPNDAGQPGPPPEVTLLSKGYQYLTEQRYDAIEPVLEQIRRYIVALDLPLRSVEVEFGPSQCEFTFGPTTGLVPADLMVLFRSAVKQICVRLGYHATFMCRPKLPNLFASGWHLHQSLVDRATGANLFMSKDALLSPLATAYLGGLITHARAGAVFATPTLNGYKRYRAYSLAPDRAVWGRDNRGVMVRVLGAPGDPSTHIENRIGEPAANPYLYMAAQVAAGLDGIDRNLDPGPSADQPYETKAPFLPKSLQEALTALRDDSFYRGVFGDGFIDYYLRLKMAEVERFEAEVTDWEQREYFEIL